MTAERQIRLERDDSGQTIHLPADLALPGNEAFVRKEGDVVIIRPVNGKTSNLLEWLQKQEPIGEDFDFDEKGPYPREVDL